MGLVDAFDATWSAARATFGPDALPEGAQFEHSSRQLSYLHGMVKSATAGAAWTGTAADAHSVATNACSHELGHALHNPREDRSSEDAYVDSRRDGEGAAVMNPIKIEREILAAGGPEITPAETNDDDFKRICDSYPQAGSSYGTLVPSTDPSTNYREYDGRAYK